VRWLALLPALLLSSHRAQSQPHPLSPRADSLFAEFTTGSSPGLAVGVVRGGRLIFSNGYGLADLEHRVPITPATVFDVASVSKQFAGLALAILAEEGKVGLDDNVRRYIPELPDVAPPITIRHLLHHTSGLRDWPGTLAVAGWRFDDVIAFDQILTMAYHQRTRNFVPGAEYTYSNTGYNLLAEVVARVSKQSFRRWTDSVFFQPLGMRRSVFRDDHTLVIPDRAFGYTRRPDGSWQHVTNNLTALGSSSLMSTVDDLARWLINFDSARVGGANAMSRWRTRGVLNDGSTIPYAFGISHGLYRGQPTLAHSGSWAAFVTYLVHFPQLRAGIVVLANSPRVNAGRAAMQLADLFLGADLGPAPPATPPAVAASTPSAATLDRFTGTYKLGPGWYVTIRRDGNALTAQATNEGVVQMTPTGDRTFWIPAYGAPMTFAADGEGHAAHVTYRGKDSPRLPDTPPAVTPLEALVGDYYSEELQSTWHVELRGGALVMRHRRHGVIPLTRRWGDDFGGAVWFLRSVEFTPGPARAVNGMVVNVDERSRNIHFAKVR